MVAKTVEGEVYTKLKHGGAPRCPSCGHTPENGESFCVLGDAGYAEVALQDGKLRKIHFYRSPFNWKAGIVICPRCSWAGDTTQKWGLKWNQED